MSTWRIKKCYNVCEVCISFIWWLYTVCGIDMAQGLRPSEITGETHSITFYVTT